MKRLQPVIGATTKKKAAHKKNIPTEVLNKKFFLLLHYDPTGYLTAHSSNG